MALQNREPPIQGKDTMQPETLAEKASHLNQCIGHLRNLVNLPVTESPDHDGIKNAAEKAYLEAHQFDPRDLNTKESVRTEKEVSIKTISYRGMKPLSNSASDFELQLQDRSMELIEVLYSLLKTPTKLDAYRPQLESMITTLESLYDHLIPEADDEPSHSPDFTSANWYGTRYTFAKGNQAETIRVLWEAWEAGGHSLSQESIGEKICSKADRFELQKVFRTRQEDGGYSPHPAWGTMIRQSTKGSYCFEKRKKRP